MLRVPAGGSVTFSLLDPDLGCVGVVAVADLVLVVGGTVGCVGGGVSGCVVGRVAGCGAGGCGAAETGPCFELPPEVATTTAITVTTISAAAARAAIARRRAIASVPAAGRPRPWLP